jgi:soluble lytic murein transglycosylase-like protein
MVSLKGIAGIDDVRALMFAVIVVVLVFIVATQAFPMINPNAPTGPTTQYDVLINKASATYGVEVVLIKAVIKKESNFKPDAVSASNAKGLMQLTGPAISDLADPLTVVGKKCNLKITDPFDPEQNINGGTCYLSYLLSKYNNKELALAAYNCGQGNINALISKYGNSWSSVEPHLDERCKSSETRPYVRLVLAYYDDYGGTSGFVST